MAFFSSLWGRRERLLMSPSSGPGQVDVIASTLAHLLGGEYGIHFSRSVVLRAEIGPFPPRNRYISVSRSVVFRTEIGPVPVGVCGGLVVWDVVCLVGVVVVGVAHGRVGSLQDGGCFLLE